MNAIIYFFLNSGIVIFAVALVSFILGYLVARQVYTNSNANQQANTADTKKLSEEYERALANAKKFYAEQSAKPKQDKDLGYIYTEKPDVEDDLSEIYGIGHVTHKQLNQLGVYTFRQIALWDKETLTRYIERLDWFKDRAYWDDWMNQAKNLHKSKYGSDI